MRKVEKAIPKLLHITSFSLLCHLHINTGCICRKTLPSGMDFPRLRRYSKHICTTVKFKDMRT
ncbi:hypothetical protein AZ09_02595 [Acetobacter aceti 1023]|nr:hypothetical protein AZ09_02595 [Acetobacter aceti 1023]